MLENKESHSFEIVLQVRDLKGRPTGRTKSYSSDSPADICGWFDRESWRPLNKKSKKDKVKSKATTGEDGAKILKEMLLSQEQEN